MLHNLSHQGWKGHLLDLSFFYYHLLCDEMVKVIGRELRSEFRVTEIIILFLFGWLDWLWTIAAESAWHDHRDFWQLCPICFLLILLWLNYTWLQVSTDSFLNYFFFATSIPIYVCSHSAKGSGLDRPSWKLMAFIHPSIVLCKRVQSHQLFRH